MEVVPSSGLSEWLLLGFVVVFVGFVYSLAKAAIELASISSRKKQ